jgi:hypothetical protein
LLTPIRIRWRLSSSCYACGAGLKQISVVNAIMTGTASSVLGMSAVLGVFFIGPWRSLALTVLLAVLVETALAATMPIKADAQRKRS